MSRPAQNLQPNDEELPEAPRSAAKLNQESTQCISGRSADLVRLEPTTLHVSSSRQSGGFIAVLARWRSHDGIELDRLKSPALLTRETGKNFDQGEHPPRCRHQGDERRPQTVTNGVLQTPALTLYRGTGRVHPFDGNVPTRWLVTRPGLRAAFASVLPSPRPPGARRNVAGTGSVPGACHF